MEGTFPPQSAPTERGVFRSVLRIGLPVAGTQFAFMLLGVVDTALLGHRSELELAASAIANMWNWAFLSLALGLVLGAEPFISQAVGRKDSEGVGLGLQHAIVTALLASVPTSVLLLFTEPALLLLGQAPEVARLAAEYNWIRIPSVPAFLVFVALRIFLQGLSLTSPALYVATIANVLNFGCGAALIFGYGPIPALGLRGAAIAATVTSVLLPLLLWAWIRTTNLDRDYRRPWDRKSVALGGLMKVFGIGGPMALQTSIEAWGFVIALMLAGWLGTSELSAHQISMNVAALAFMIPLGIAIGGATSVGHAIGAQDRERARGALRASFALAALWSLVATPSLYLGRNYIAAAFTSDENLRKSVATLVLFVAGFQFIDCAQAVGAGVLRGMGKPFGPAVLNFLGFALGLPLAYFLGRTTELGVIAVWIGLTFRMLLVSTGVTIWAHWMAKRPLSELTVKH
jgi:MATE family multidrug resistance protein